MLYLLLSLSFWSLGSSDEHLQSQHLWAEAGGSVIFLFCGCWGSEDFMLAWCLSDLLLWRDAVTPITLKQEEIFNWSSLHFQRFSPSIIIVVQQGSMQADTLLEKELKVLTSWLAGKRNSLRHWVWPGCIWDLKESLYSETLPSTRSHLLRQDHTS